MKKRATKKPTKPSDAAPGSKRFCGLKSVPPRAFGAHVSPDRARAIISSSAKWVNGTNLKYWFFSGPDSQKKAMRQAFKVWMDLGIGISFAEVSTRDDAHIRIAFEDDGSWSYLGREILTISKSEATMNIGWDISADLETGVHEIGHTLGMPHEHQNPNAGIVWNEQKVYDSLAKPPNGWSREQTFWNIIRKIPASEVTGTDWDPNSIMHYPFEAGLISQPAKYATGLNPAGGLSANDKAWIKKTYPASPGAAKVLQAFSAAPIAAASGGQAEFAFKPTRSRRYRMRTFGNLDVVMVLARIDGSTETYLAGADDSGEDRNSEIEMRLDRGSTYSIRLRVLYREPESDCAIMVW